MTCGGAPAWVGDRLQVVEGFRFSPSFDFATLQFLSANTFLFAPEALEVEHPLTWFYVEKEVDGRRAVQIERLVNELSRFVPTAFLATPRGLQGRFLPIKSPADLEAFRAEPAFVERFSAV